MKIVIKQTAAWFKPIKGHGTVGTLQRIIVSSEWVFIITVIISVLCECVNQSHSGWLQFIENYAIGTACSVVIVIVMTIVQFVSERNSVYDEFYHSLFKITSLLDFANDSNKRQARTLQVDLGELDKELEVGREKASKLYWFNIIKEEKYLRVRTVLFKMFVYMHKDYKQLSMPLNENEIKQFIIEIKDMANSIGGKENSKLFEIFTSDYEGENNDQL